MKKFFGALAAAVLFIGIAHVALRPAAIHEPTEESLSYFADTVTRKVQMLEGYEKMGLAGGVDGFTLRKAYPNLVPADFANVQAYQGYYFEENGELFYSGNAASNSPVILREGMKVLLQNIATRLAVSPHTKEGVDDLLKELESVQPRRLLD